MQAYNETWQALAETNEALQSKILAALDSNTNALKSLGHQQQNSFLDERALLTGTPDPPVTLKDDRGKTFAVDNGMIDIFLKLGKQTNKQFKLISVDPNSNKFKVNGIDVFLVPDGIKLKGKVYHFSKGFAMFINSRDVTERDIKGDENKKNNILRILVKNRAYSKIDQKL